MLVLVLAAGVAFALAACGDDDSDGDGGAGPELEDVVLVEGSQADVNVLDNTFNEQNIQVQAGTRVVWTNNGRQDHDIVPADEDAGFGVDREDFGPDAIYEHTFDEPGTYRYYCSLHGTESAGMIGAVVVQD